MRGHSPQEEEEEECQEEEEKLDSSIIGDMKLVSIHLEKKTQTKLTHPRKEEKKNNKKNRFGLFN